MKLVTTYFNVLQAMAVTVCLLYKEYGEKFSNPYKMDSFLMLRG